MSNENSNLRVGSAGAGLFVGSTEILGGGFEAILAERIDLPGGLWTLINVSGKDIPLILFDYYGGGENIELLLKNNSIYQANLSSGYNIEVQEKMSNIYYKIMCDPDETIEIFVNNGEEIDKGWAIPDFVYTNLLGTVVFK